MATVLKQQQSLNIAFKKRAGIGLLALCIGAIIIIVFTQAALVAGFFFLAGTILIKEGYKFHLGAVGENRVARVLNRFPDDWFIINDMVVGPAQIDHIIVSPAGVYTIETKNYRGTIYGNAEKQKWSQVINHHKTTFYNPVKQGNGHSVALRKFLAECGFENIWVNTIVVFAEPHAQLKVFSPKVPVLYLSELRAYFKHQKPIMNPEHCSKIATCVSQLTPA